MKKIKRILAIYISIIMILSICDNYSVVVRAYDKKNGTNYSQNVNTINDISFDADDTIGSLVADELQATDEQDDTYPNTVSDLRIEDNIAYVNLQILDDATLVVAIYDETDNRLITSESTQVEPDDKNVTVELPAEKMPEYFVAKAYLVDESDYTPLSLEYETSLYTKEMQEFLQMEITDFEEEKAINFDDNDETNFGIVNEGVIVIDEEESGTELVSQDDNNYVYVFNDPNKKMRNIYKGNTVLYESQDGSLIAFCAENVEIDNDTVSITGSEIELEDIFEYLRLEQGDEIEDYTFEPTSDFDENESWRYLYDYSSIGLVDESFVARNSVNGLNGANAFNKANLHKFKVDIEKATKVGVEVTFKKKELLDKHLSFQGSADFETAIAFELYIAKNEKYLKSNFDISVELKGEVEFDTDDEEEKGIIPLKGKMVIPVCPMVKVTLTPAIVLEGKGSISFNAKINVPLGWKVEKGKCQNISKKTELTSNVNFEGDIFFGLKLTGDLKACELTYRKIKFSAASLSLSGEAGVYITAKANKSLKDNLDTRHDCDKCIAYEAYFGANLGGKIKLLNSDKLTYKADLYEIKIKVKDWYYSVDNKKLGNGTCPYQSTKVVFEVQNEDGKLMKYATIIDNKNSKAYVTDSEGKVTFWARQGKDTFTISKDGYCTIEKLKVTVGDKKVTKKVVLSKDSNDQSEESGERKDADYYFEQYGGVPINETTFPDEYFREEIECYDRNDDGYLQESEIEKISYLNINFEYIFSLVGIDYLTDLRILHCSYSWISSLDVSKNVNLETLDCYGTDLTSLDVSKNVNLETLDCSDTNISSLDVSKNVNLKMLSCNSTNLTSLDVSKNVNLWSLDCRDTNISSLDVSKNVNLETLDCYGTNLSSLDISNNVNLESLDCDGTNLTSLDVSKNVNLEYLRCDGTDLSSLDISNNVNLESLYCARTSISSLDVSKNVNLGMLRCHSTNLTSLDVSKNVNLRSLDCRDTNISSLDISKNKNLIYIYCDDDVTIIGSRFTASAQSNDYLISKESLTCNMLTSSPQNDNLSKEVDISTTGDISNNNTVCTSGSSTYANLIPGTVYNFYILSSRNVNNPLGSENVRYISQGVADSDGNITFDYAVDEECVDPDIFIVGMEKYDIENATVTAEDMDENGDVQDAKVTVIFGDKQLVYGHDYYVEGDYSEENAGTYTVTICGCGNYKGKVDATYKLNHVYVTDKAFSATCTKDGKTEGVHCKACGDVQIAQKTIAAKGHKYVTTTTKATTSTNGSVVKKCSDCGSTTNTIIYYPKTITLSATSTTYTGSAIKPTVTIKDSAGKTITAVNYTVSYTNNTAVGKATIKITFKGNYSGSISKTFKIVPKTTTIGTPVIASDGITVKWSKNTSGAGYYIYRSVNGAAYTKVKTITSNATTSWKDTTAKTNGNKYQYKIIAYKTVSGTTYTSAASAIKTIYFLTRPTVTLANQASAIKVSWGKNAKATGYYVYKSTDGGKTYKKIKTVTSNATVSYTDTAAKTNGTKYMYKVEAYKTVSGTTYKSAASAVKTTYFVSKPAISSATNSAAGKLLVKWARNAKASGYQIQYSTSSSFASPKSVTATGTASTLSKTIASLTKGKTYYVRIRSYKTVGETKYYSAWSASKNVKIMK